MNIIKGNLITLAKEGKFDHIAQGCNCFQSQSSGLAPQMVEAFQTDEFPMEMDDSLDPCERFGSIDGVEHILGEEFPIFKNVIVWNWYTQYYPGKNFDITAFKICCKKFALLHYGDEGPETEFRYKLGLPMIGAGIGGGDWEEISKVITEELEPYFDVTIVEWDGTKHIY